MYTFTYSNNILIYKPTRISVNSILKTYVLPFTYPVRVSALRTSTKSKATVIKSPVISHQTVRKLSPRLHIRRVSRLPRSRAPRKFVGKRARAGAHLSHPFEFIKLIRARTSYTHNRELIAYAKRAFSLRFSHPKVDFIRVITISYACDMLSVSTYRRPV